MMSIASRQDRAGCWQALRGEAGQGPPEWDLIVVGGGISGAGVMREAARRGLRVLLLEQQDFAWGTSSRSSKMVHGGIRYLAMGDLKLTRHSLQERELLIAEAPGLVERMGYYYTLRRGTWLPCLAVKLILWLYDRIAGISDHRRISLPALATRFRGIRADQFKGVFYYTDAVTDDSRLVLRVIQEALKAPTQVMALNYVRVARLLNGESGEVVGVVAEDQVSGTGTEIRARAIVNATGAWADRLRNQVNPEVRVRPLRGSHIVVPAERLPVSAALTLAHPGDGRTMFIYPWENRTVVGTTDLDHRLDLDIEASISAGEVQYLLDAANATFTGVELTAADILSTWSGVRPIIGSEKSRDPSKERRDHAVWRDGRLITVSGGKLTTFRLIALDVLEAVCGVLPDMAPVRNGGRMFASLQVQPEELLPANPEFAAVLLGRYGDAAVELVAQASEIELQPLHNTRFCLAECRWSASRESVRHLDDLLLRRTHLGLLLAEGAAELAPQLRAIMQQELHWDDARWAEEWARYQCIWQRHYSLPESLPDSMSAADSSAIADSGSSA